MLRSTWTLQHSSESGWIPFMFGKPNQTLTALRLKNVWGGSGTVPVRRPRARSARLCPPLDIIEPDIIAYAMYSEISLLLSTILADAVDVKRGDQLCETVSQPSIQPDKVIWPMGSWPRPCLDFDHIGQNSEYSNTRESSPGNMGRVSFIPVRVGHFYSYWAESAVSCSENALYSLAFRTGCFQSVVMHKCT